MAYIQHRQIVLPTITLDKPAVDAQRLEDGKANWNFTFPSGGGGSSNDSSNATQIGKLDINDGQVHVRDAKVAADFQIAVSTRDGDNGKGQIVANAKGTYAKQPITADFIGGALLSLRDASQPYPIDLHVANGPTRSRWSAPCRTRSTSPAPT